MLRPPGLEIDALVDASVQAYSRATVERRFEASQLPRLNEAGIVEPAVVNIAIRFSVVDEQVAMDGALNGFVTMTCQRCMQPVKIDVSDNFRLVIVDEEADRATEDGSGYEPIVADPAHLDMRWIAEEQTLLSVPLVPKHDDVNCAGGELPTAGGEGTSSQRPFADLKKLLRDR
jgi:uncharacterized protein